MCCLIKYLHTTVSLGYRHLHYDIFCCYDIYCILFMGAFITGHMTGHLLQVIWEQRGVKSSRHILPDLWPRHSLANLSSSLIQGFEVVYVTTMPVANRVAKTKDGLGRAPERRAWWAQPGRGTPGAWSRNGAERQYQPPSFPSSHCPSHPGLWEGHSHADNPARQTAHTICLRYETQSLCFSLYVRPYEGPQPSMWAELCVENQMTCATFIACE